MESILKYYISTNGSVQTAKDLLSILNGGHVVTNGNFFTKPTNNFYVLASTYSYNIFTQSLGYFTQGPVNNGFDTYISQLLGILDSKHIGYLNEQGLVEATSDPSLLGLFMNNFDFSGSGGDDLLSNSHNKSILKNGVVIYYDEILDNMVLSSIDSFINYSQNTDVTIPSSVRYNYYSIEPNLP